MQDHNLADEAAVDHAVKCYTKARTMMLSSGCDDTGEMMGIMCFMIAILTIATKQDTWTICDNLKGSSHHAKELLEIIRS